MQIVIDMQDNDYRKVQDGRASVAMMRNAIRNGTPLDQEPKTGHWYYDEEREATGIYAICSNCDEEIYQTGDFKYCPNCGAKMK